MFFSIVLIIIMFLMGNTRPYKTAWLILFLLPLLGPSGFYIGLDSMLPVNAYRLGFFGFLGILLKTKTNILTIATNNKFTNIIIAYFVVIFGLQVIHYPTPTIFTFLPYYLMAVFLPFVIIRSEKDLEKLLNIFVLQSVIISVFVILEFFTSFSLPTFMWKTSGLSLDSLQAKGALEISRSGVYRVAGIHGNSVQTAAHLAFLFPLTLLYWNKAKSGISSIPVLLALVSFVLLQTRASVFAVILSFVLLWFLHIFNTKLQTSYFISVKQYIGIAFGMFILSLISIKIFTIASRFFDGIVSLGTSNVEKGIDIMEKIDRIPIALALFSESPIYGWVVSPRYAYYVLMGAQDLPSIFLYLLGGGVILAGLFLTLMFKTIIGTYNEIKKENSILLRNIYLYSTIAIFAGFFVTFSNMIQEQFMSMFFLFVSIKIVARNRKIKRQIYKAYWF